MHEEMLLYEEALRFAYRYYKWGDDRDRYKAEKIARRLYCGNCRKEITRLLEEADLLWEEEEVEEEETETEEEEE